MIKRFWFEFLESSKEPLPIGFQHGCGLSAYDCNDAVQLLKERVFKSTGFLIIEKMIEDVDVSTLDRGHVLPNMGNVTVRGIWFPLGY